jgi:hypothetical protein
MSCSVAHNDNEFMKHKFVLRMCSNNVIALYTVGLQLNVMKYAKEHGNKIAEW